jgi:hypothetical protein|tara:strand:- start:1341 stop:1970 length:630 start_codon:yes stop_codon:yes gene_type:complete
MKNMFSSAKIDKLIKNKIVLWLLFAIALVNMYAYLMSANELYIAFMLLTGFILSFFSKNMVVILFFSICIPSILRFVMEWKGLQEGLANNAIREGLETKDDATSESNAEINGSNFHFPADKITRMKAIIGRAQDKADQITDPEKRTNTKTLLDLEENVVDQLHLIGKMMKKQNKSGSSLESSSFQPETTEPTNSASASGPTDNSESSNA